jgi:hypothetical protein
MEHGTTYMLPAFLRAVEDDTKSAVLPPRHIGRKCLPEIDDNVASDLLPY